MSSQKKKEKGNGFMDLERIINGFLTHIPLCNINSEYSCVNKINNLQNFKEIYKRGVHVENSNLKIKNKPDFVYISGYSSHILSFSTSIYIYINIYTQKIKITELVLVFLLYCLFYTRIHVNF